VAEPEDQPKVKMSRIKIEADEALAQGVYSNLAMVHQTDSEMVLDFLFLQPTQPKATLRARIVTSPRHVKRLIAVLQDQLARYERLHGEVKLPKPPEEIVH
jgi:hypothetical protein